MVEYGGMPSTPAETCELFVREHTDYSRYTSHCIFYSKQIADQIERTGCKDMPRQH